MLLFRKEVISVLVVFLLACTTGRQLAASDTDSVDIGDLSSQISKEVANEVNRATAEIKEKCGPQANSISGDTCYAACKGNLIIDNSSCTCNGKPCVSWKVGETGPTTVAGETNSVTNEGTVQSSAKAASILLVAGMGCVFILLG